MSLQRSVQRQNEASKAEIERVASSFAQDGSGELDWLRQLLSANDLDPASGILARLHQVPEQDGEFYRGIWLSADGQFWEFEATVPGAPNAPAQVERFQNVSNSIVVNPHVPGTGKSFGFLALQVLSEQHGA